MGDLSCFPIPFYVGISKESMLHFHLWVVHYLKLPVQTKFPVSFWWDHVYRSMMKCGPDVASWVEWGTKTIWMVKETASLIHFKRGYGGGRVKKLGAKKYLQMSDMWGPQEASTILILSKAWISSLDNKAKERHESMFLLTNASGCLWFWIVVLGGEQGSFMHEFAENRRWSPRKIAASCFLK